MSKPRWGRGWSEALAVLGRNSEAINSCRKGEAWKVDLARYLREGCLTPYRLINPMPAAPRPYAPNT